MMPAAVAPGVPASPAASPPSVAGARATMGDTGTMRVSALHFGAAMLFLLAGAAGIAVVAPRVASGVFLDPRVVAVTHLFTLGWLTTTIFGALYQLLPVALGTPVRWARAGHASIGLIAPGIACFVAGVAMSDDVIRHLGLALVMPGLLLGIVNVAASLPRAPRRDLTWWSVAIAIIALTATIVLGGVLVHNLKTGVLLGGRVRVLAVHVHVALAGWVLTMIVGISQRLLPMFLLAPGVADRWARRALALIAGGTVVLTTGLLVASDAITRAGALALAAGLTAFLIQARGFFAARMRRRLDPGLRIAATGLVAMGAAGALGLVALALGASHRRVAAAYGAMAVLSVMLYVVGHFYKIVPFLAWIVRYRGRVGREPVPAVSDLYSARLAIAQWIIMTAATAVIVAGTLAGHAHCVRVGAVLLTAGVLLFASQIVRVAMPLREKRP